jgi:hypothetical protein
MEQSPGACKINVENPGLFPFAEIWKTYRYSSVTITHNLRRKIHGRTKKELGSTIVNSFRELGIPVLITVETEVEGECCMATTGFKIQKP